MIDLINKIVLHICYRCGEDEEVRGIEHDCENCLLSEVIDEIKSINNKPHGRLIDADKLCEAMNEKKIPVNSRINYEIVNAPTVLATTDRPQGEWIKHEIEDTCRWVECSECHKEYPNIEMNFCPNCGKRMRGEK